MAAAKANAVPVTSQEIVATDAADVFTVVDAAKPVVISDFNASEDKLDLSSLIDHDASGVTKAIEDFVLARPTAWESRPSAT